MGEKIGYARVSTREQNLSSQEDALSKAGCIRIFTDKISGKEFNREGLKACMDYLPTIGQVPAYTKFQPTADPGKNASDYFQPYRVEQVQTLNVERVQKNLGL